MCGVWEKVWGSVGGGMEKCGWVRACGGRCGKCVGVRGGERKCVGVWGEVRGDVGRSLVGVEEVSAECGRV